MILRDDFDRLLATWLDEGAGEGTPDYLDETIEGIARIRQRPVWLSPGRWLPMQLTMPRVAVPRFVPLLALIALLIAAVLAAASFVGSQRRLPPPFGRAETGLFVYDTNGEIYVRDPDGQPQPLITGQDAAFNATWSRDGSKVVFWAGELGGVGQLRVADAAGAGVSMVASDVRLPLGFMPQSVSWSPDGHAIAFSSGDGVLEIVNVDGTGRHVVGSGPLLRFDPAWSPDGSLIAFRGQSTVAMDEPRRVHVIKPDGTGERPVSDESFGVNAMMGPNWSVGGQLLYDAVYGEPRGVDGGDIVVATQGSGGWSEETIVDGPSIDWLPRWSNDGTRIVFLRSRPGGSEGDQMIAEADGSRVRRISDRVMSTAAACWAPDDQAIAALTGQEGQPINGQQAATYILFDANSGRVLVEMPTPGIEGVMDCSWQRLSP